MSPVASDIVEATGARSYRASASPASYMSAVLSSRSRDHIEKSITPKKLKGDISEITKTYKW